MAKGERLESRARARALQALYAWDVRGQEGLELVASRVWDDLGVGPEERKVAGTIVGEMIRHGEEIDRELGEVTTNWRLERLGAIERTVLRLAAAELRRGETPPKVVIQEAVHLAERYGSEQSARFVNGIVDALARRLGRL
jgi:transcription antitermination protein NusB